MEDKIYKNALICEKLTKLNKYDRNLIVKELLKNKTQKALGEELGIPEGTIHNWFTLRETNKTKVGDFNIFYHKIKDLDPKDVTDWGRLQQIRDRINILLLNKKTILPT